MRVRRHGGAWLLFASVVLLGGCGASDSGLGAGSVAASASVSSSADAVPQTKPWVDLQVGECVAEVPAVDVGVVTVNVVDCAAAHEAEVFLLAPVAVNAAIADVAGQACAAGADRYTGGEHARALSVTSLIDSRQDRTGAIPLPSTVICLLQTTDGPLEGSVRG
jgi:hypothetical protein